MCYRHNTPYPTKKNDPLCETQLHEEEKMMRSSCETQLHEEEKMIRKLLNCILYMKRNIEIY